MSAGRPVVTKHDARSLVDTALSYTARGWWVFPCLPKSKAPATEHGFKNATLDPAQVRQWWKDNPTYNIGLDCGRSGLAVVDVDPRNGGAETLAALEHEHGPLPHTVRGLTGRGDGGLHFYFHVPEGSKSPAKLGRGVDVKAQGGYVIAPPSIHPDTGGKYAWAAGAHPDDSPVADLPAWIAGLAPKPAPPIESSVPLPDGERRRLGRPTLEFVANGAPQGEQRARAVAAARAYLSAGYSVEETAAALWRGLQASPQDGDRPWEYAHALAIATDLAIKPARTSAPVYTPNGTAHMTNPDSDPWPPMEKLPPTCPPVPNLPPEMVPDPLREWLDDMAQRASIPLEFVVCPAIIAIGAVVGRRLGIRPVDFDDYLVVPNLWGGIVANPGTLKSFAVEQGVKPLSRLAAKAKEQFKQGESEHLARHERLKVEQEAIKQEMGKAAKEKKEGVSDMDSLERDYAAKAHELAEATGYEQRYITQDATTEKLGELLQENPRGLLVLRDELAGWLRILDKPGREGDREFYLEAWNGTGAYTFDRIGRGTVHIDAVCLSIVGGIQPGKLRGYVHEAIEGEAGADGLLQRIQLLVWPDSLGQWRQVDRWPDSRAKDRAFRVFEWLDCLDLQQVGAQIKEGEIPSLRFLPDAQQLFNAWRGELENRLRSNKMEGTPAFAAHLAKYRSLMPSLALLFHLVNLSQMGNEAGVSLEATKLAAAWCEFLEAHAKKVYAAELYPGVEAAHTLASKLKQKVIADGEPIRNIYRREWTGLNTPSQVNRALAVLEEFGWVRVIVQEAGEQGGRPSEIVRINSTVWESEDG